ncbi:hypothetical protein TDB9533_04519 [Thalassocella blandensis]|nr:hypothetical protein TDB9533_04519 [Thalassocella blandensis]
MEQLTNVRVSLFESDYRYSEISVSLSEENKQLKRLLVEVINKQSRAEKMGRVFHDFNNMLSSTMGYASLAIERVAQSDDEKLQRYLNNIERAAIRARDLVKECLDQRQQERHVENPCNVFEALNRLGVNAHAEGDSAKTTRVSMSEENLESVVNFLLHGAVARQSCSGATAQVQVTTAEYCENCDAELPLGALRVELDGTAVAAPDGELKLTDDEKRMDMAMAAALINLSGGHMCDAQTDSGAVTENSIKTIGVSYFRTLNLDEQMQ